MKKISPIAFILVLTAIVYARVVSFEFVRWDDNVFIFENPMMFLPFAEAIKQAFGSLFNRDYLPISLMSWWLDHFIMGEPHAGLSHFGNFMLHLTNVFLVWCCLRPLVSQRVATFACLIFALHPLQVESVALASSRNNILCATFALAAVLCAQRLDRGKRYWLGYPLFHLLGLLSKAIIVFMPVVIFVCDLFVHRRSWKQALKRNWIAMALSAAMVLLRIFAYGQSNSQMASVALDPQRFALIPVQALNAIGFYFSTLVFPYDLALVYPPFQMGFMVWLHALIVVVILALSAIHWKKSRHPIVVLSLAWTFFFLLPVLQIFPRLNYVNDRYMYLPIVGMAVWMAITVQRYASQFQRYSFSVIVAVGSALMVLTHLQIATWQNDKVLWQYTTEKRPWSAVARMNLGSTYERLGLIDEAIVEYERATNARVEEDTAAQAFSNLATLHSRPEDSKRYNISLALHYMRLAEQTPMNEASRMYLRYNRARLELLAGNKAGAREMTERLLADLKGNSDSMLNEVRMLAEGLLSKL